MSAVGWGSRWRIAGESVEARIELLGQSVPDSVARELVSGVASAIAHEPILVRTGPTARVVLVDHATGEPLHAWEFERDERSAREFLSMVERDLERFSIADFEGEYSIGPLRPEDRG